MFWIKSLIYNSNNHSGTSDVSFPHINYIVCWATIISVLETNKNILVPVQQCLLLLHIVGEIHVTHLSWRSTPFIIFNGMQKHVYYWNSILQGFWYFARSWSREFQVNPLNPTKFTKTRETRRNSLGILPNTCRHNIFKCCLGCWGCLLAVNLLIYIETQLLQRVNNIPKLPGILRLMLRKTGKIPRSKKILSQAFLAQTIETGDEIYRFLARHEECCILWTSPTKMTIFFWTVQSTTDNAWKPA